MKPFLLITFLTGSFLFSKAQFTTGQKVLSGNVSFSRTNNINPVYSSDANQTTFNFSPSFGKFKNATTLIGFKLLFGTSKTNQEAIGADYEQENSSAGIGFFVQKIKPLGKDFFLFAETGLSGNYMWAKSITPNQPYDEIRNKGFAIQVYVTPGLGYKITPRFIADITLNNIAYIGYSHVKTEYKISSSSPTTVEKSDALSIGTGLEKNALSNIGIGIRWLLK